MHIYFDNVLIDDNSIMGLTNSYNLYKNNFYLGSTASNSFRLTVSKDGVNNQPNFVTIVNNSINFAVLHVDEIIENNNSYEYALTDAQTLFDFYYDASQIFVSGSTTLLAIAEDICDKVGIELGTTNFRGYDKVITWYDNTKTAREYIGYIAELNGGFARIGTDGKLYFIKQNMFSKYTINIDDCEQFNLGSYHKITRVVLDLGVDIWEFGDDTYDTLYLNNENVFITQESEVQAIYDEIKNFEFYSIDCGQCPINPNIYSGDVITYTDGTTYYPTIACYDTNYFGKWNGAYKLEINSIKVEETSKTGINTRMKNIQVKVDRDANSITQLISTTNGLTGEVSRMQQTLSDTYSKIEVQKIVDGTGTDGVVVSKVITEAGYTFDKEGLKIYTDENSYNALHNNTGTYYKDGDTILSQTTKDGTITKDMALYGTYYYGIDENVVIENFTKDDAMFMSMKYVDDNNEECVGHFYNGS